MRYRFGGLNRFKGRAFVGQCDARVTVDSVNAEGEILFIVNVEDCTDSSGGFEFTYRVREGDNGIREYRKSTSWNRTFDDADVYIDENLYLPEDHELLSVDVEDGSIQCYCYLSGQPTIKGELAPAQVHDSDTVRVVNDLFSKTSAYRNLNYRIVRINQVRVLWGEARLDVSQAKRIPTKYEERVIRMVNCDPENSKPFNRKIKVRTKEKVVYEKKRTVTTSEDFNVGITFSAADLGKINAGLVRKNSINLSSRETQEFEEEISYEYDEVFDVPPLTEYVYKYTAEKGLLIVPIVGDIIIDAHFLMQRTDAPVLKGEFWLSDGKLLPRPEDRRTSFGGELINESYDNLDIKHIPRRIEASAPECSVHDEIADVKSGVEVSSTFIGNG